MKSLYKVMIKCFSYILTTILIMLFSVSFTIAAKINAADTSKYDVLSRGPYVIKIDAKLDDWVKAENILFMGKETWEPLGGTWNNNNDLSAELRIIYDKDNLYFALQVWDDEYIAEAGNPWENDGVQFAIDSSAGQIPPGFPNATTHLYNFPSKTAG